MSHLTERARRAEQIAKNPAKFKVCEGCDSIVGHSADTCPNCHGYRFNESPERVVEQARILGSRPQSSVRPEDME